MLLIPPEARGPLSILELLKENKIKIRPSNTCDTGERAGCADEQERSTHLLPQARGLPSRRRRAKGGGAIPILAKRGVSIAPKTGSRFTQTWPHTCPKGRKKDGEEGAGGRAGGEAGGRMGPGDHGGGPQGERRNVRPVDRLD